MAQIKFFRSSGASSLSQVEPHDGAIYVINTGESAGPGLTKGEIYVDMGLSRLKVSGQQAFSYSQQEISELTNVTSSLGAIYIVTDSEGNYVGVKIGDGSAYIIDLPTVDFTKIQQHVKAYAAPIISEVDSGSGEVRLILSADIAYSN